MKHPFAGTAAALLAAVLFFNVSAEAVSARSAMVLDAVSGRVLYDRDCDSRSLIASTTKIMTALVVCEQCNVLDRMRIPREAVGIEGSSMYLREGEVLTIQELLYGLMLSSGNDAAVALAIYCGGTVEGFAQMMNDKARVLGLSGTHFENPNGLDSPGHYSTARDLAVLAAYAMDNPVFAQTVSTKTVTIGQRCLRNHNKLLWLVEGADGVKTGYTKAAGRILVSSATRDGRRLIAVTINDPDDWQDHQALLEEGFRQYSLETVVSAGDVLGTVEIAGGVPEKVPVLAKGDFVYSLSRDDRPQIVISGKGLRYPPVVEGAEAGFAYVLLEGRAVGKVPLVYGAASEMPEEKSFWKKLFGGKRDGAAASENTVGAGSCLPAGG